jgi:hypothetical protein
MARRDRERGNVTLLRRADVWVFGLYRGGRVSVVLGEGRKGKERRTQGLL